MTGNGEEYERDGYAVVRGLLDNEILAACRSHLGSLPRGRGGGPLVGVPIETDVFAASVATDRRLTRLAARFLGSADVACFGYTYMVKAARSGLPAWWHQDGHPWRERLGVESAVTLWAALDDADAGNGALQVVVGSHVSPARPLEAAFRVAPEGGAGEGGDGPGLFPVGVDPGPLDASRIRVLVMAPGDVSAHHPALVHGSAGNWSDRDRRALVLRYRPL